MEINILPFDRDPAYPPHPLLHAHPRHACRTSSQVWDHWYTQEDEFHPSPIYYRLSLLCFFTYTHPRSRDIFVVIKLYTDSFTKIHLF